MWGDSTQAVNWNVLVKADGSLTFVFRADDLNETEVVIERISQEDARSFAHKILEAIELSQRQGEDALR